MARFYEYLNILVMPTDACNMNCIYCFHKSSYNEEGRMDLKTVEKLLSITTPYYKGVNFLWHGGEPLLMGLDFYKEVLKLQNKTTCKIKNSIQSNLTLMTTEIASFLTENYFAISGSHDGVCNEQLRGNGDAILQGRKKITELGCTCGIITVVSSHNIHTLIDNYKFFKENNMNYNFNLYLDVKDFENAELKLDENIAIEKIKEFFTYWAFDTDSNIDISYFRHILEFILFRKKSVCVYNSCLGRWVGIRYNGDIVPCNRNFPKDYNYGNVYDYTDIGEAFESYGFKKLLSEAIIRREKCKSCEIYEFCNGGCNHAALNGNGIDGDGTANCRVLKEVYFHILDFVKNANKNGVYNEKLNKLLAQERGKI